MHICRLILLILLSAALLAACGGAPVQPSANGVTAAPAATVIAPIAGSAPTAAATAGIVSAAPNDATQARLRVGHFVFNGPNVDIFVNGQLTTNGGMAQANLPAGEFSSFLYLLPGTYSVAVVPSGQGLAQAIIGPLDVPLVAGHRYTVVMMGQTTDKHLTPLVLDETAALMKIGAAPTDSVRILVNNLAGTPGIDMQAGGKVITNVPYGGFAAGIEPVGNYLIKTTLTGDPKAVILEDNGDFNQPGTTVYGYGGHYPGDDGITRRIIGASPTSDLNSLDFLKGYSGKSLKESDQTVSFDTFLAAIKTAGLTDLLTTGGPYLLLPPTDAAWAALPKAQRDTLITNPKALAAVLRSHIIQGYYPPGSLTSKPGGSFDRTLTNLLGAKLVLLATDSGLSINGEIVGDLDSAMVANGSRVVPITKVLLPAAK